MALQPAIEAESQPCARARMRAGVRTYVACIDDRVIGTASPSGV